MALPSFFQYYRTFKKVKIKDWRLGLLSKLFATIILLFVVVIELWAWGGWLSPSPVAGATLLGTQHPTVNDCIQRLDDDF